MPPRNVAMLSIMALPIMAASAIPNPVDTLLARYKIAWEQANADDLAALYASNAELADSRSIVQGTTAIRALYQASFDNGLRKSRLDTRLEASRAIAPRTMIGRGISRITLDGSGIPQSFCGRFFAVLHKTGRNWQIAAFNEVPLACDKAFP